MTFFYNAQATERIAKNGTFITTMPADAQVIIKGERDPQTQTYLWNIYIPQMQQAPIAPLTCAYCTQQVVDVDRKCQCGAYCHLFIREKRGNQAELHRQVAMTVFTDEPGIQVINQEIQTDSPQHQLPLVTDHLDLHIADLACPRCPATFHFAYGQQAPEKYGKCEAHCFYIKPVLVWINGEVWVEQRIYDYISTPMQHLPEFDKSLAKLQCPNCERPIKDKHLRCLFCQNIIVDATLVAYTHQPDEGRKYVRIAVEADLRWIKQIQRPPHVIPIDVSQQQLTMTVDAPGWDDTITEAPQLTDKQLAERERTFPTSKNRAELRSRVVQVLDTHSYDEAEEIFGLSRGKLQKLAKEYRQRNREIDDTDEPTSQ